jgi:hypothetical protein
MRCARTQAHFPEVGVFSRRACALQALSASWCTDIGRRDLTQPVTSSGDAG